MQPLRFLALSFLALTCCGVPSHVPVTPPRDLTAKTVALVVKRPAGLRAYCSGVWVGPTTILTAQHCILGESPISYVGRDDVLDLEGEERPDAELREATLRAEDAATDLALLEATGQTYPHGISELATNVLEGEPVTNLGHPFGLWFSYAAGHVAAVRVLALEPTALYVQTTTPTSKGNSGCGLWNARGELAGIAHAGIPSGSNLAFYVHVRHVRNFLTRAGVR